MRTNFEKDNHELKMNDDQIAPYTCLINEGYTKEEALSAIYLSD